MTLLSPFLKIRSELREIKPWPPPQISNQEVREPRPEASQPVAGGPTHCCFPGVPQEHPGPRGYVLCSSEAAYLRREAALSVDAVDQQGMAWSFCKIKALLTESPSFAHGLVTESGIRAGGRGEGEATRETGRGRWSLGPSPARPDDNDHGADGSQRHPESP